MKTPHRPQHWILVALVLAALLLTLTEVHGQAAAGAPESVAVRKDVKPGRDQGLAKDERSVVTQGKRAVKRVVKRARTGVGDIDAGVAPAH